MIDGCMHIIYIGPMASVIPPAIESTGYYRSANFRIFRMRVLHAKIKTTKIRTIEFLREL